MIRQHPARLLKKANQPFDYPVIEVGKTANNQVTLWLDPSLETASHLLAAQLLAQCTDLYAKCAQWFGMAGEPVNLIMAPLSGSGDGSGGAFHYGCDFQTGGDLYIDYARTNLAMEKGLFVAELVECFMGSQGRGWNCGGSGGEALSRMLAELVSGGPGGALAGFATAPEWDAAGRPNWIDKDEGTDQDAVATGCGMVYLSWMMAQGFSAAAIAQAGGSTLAKNYETLTGKASAWSDLQAGIKALPPRKPLIVDDDPFGGIAADPQGNPTPEPAPAPSPPVPVPPNPSPAPEPAPAPAPVPPEPVPPSPGPTPVTKAALLHALSTLPE